MAFARTAGMEVKTDQADLPTGPHKGKHGDILVEGGLYGNASLVLDVVVCHPFVGDSVDPLRWCTPNPGVLKARANAKLHKHWYHSTLSMSFIPFAVTTHSHLCPEGLRLLHLLADALTMVVFARQDWTNVSQETFTAHSVRHFTRYRGRILQQAFKGSAIRLQVGVPWVRTPPSRQHDQVEDPELDLPLAPAGERVVRFAGGI